MALADVPSNGESKETSITSTSLEDSAKTNTKTNMETSRPAGGSKPVTGPATVKDETVMTEEEKKAEKDLEEDLEYPHGFKLAVILAALCLAVFLVALDQTIISTAIPKITDHFRSIKDIGWYGSSYLLTATALQPTFGRIYTIFNVRTQQESWRTHTDRYLRSNGRSLLLLASSSLGKLNVLSVFSPRS
jgi:hypothetical protein